MTVMNPIAACGINCTTCYAYQRKKNVCSGCRADTDSKLYHCSVCKIANCDLLKETKSGLCFECSKFPCARLKQIDKRYRLKYNTSLVNDLKRLQQIGLEQYLLDENTRWKCKRCGSWLCIHNSNCPTCGENLKLQAPSKG